MEIQFTNHNIRLDDGTYTKPEIGYSMETYGWFVSARRILETVFPGDKTRVRLADLGCLEGGYSVEFARMGFQVLGMEVRDSNLAACNYVKSKTDLPNLQFVKDNVLNIARYGVFDAVFCCGLLYHLDQPKAFLETLSGVTRKLVILQTHFATDAPFAESKPPSGLQKLFRKPSDENRVPNKFQLSELGEHEGLKGRWFPEFPDEQTYQDRENQKWSSWDNRQSFWVQREYLLQAIRDVGFDLVLEQYDSLGPDIAASMLHGYYRTDQRGTFIGIKTQSPI